MKTAGLVLDFYDDPRGEILKSRCPTIEDLPEQVKEAHILSPEERDVLRDEAFALILRSEGADLRKFACVDAGNTILSTVYFMENFSKLPVEAVKVAAKNLAVFNAEFGLPVPDDLLLAAETGMSTKTAAKVMSRSRDSRAQPYAGDEADWAQRTNILSVRGGADSGRVIPAANAMKTAGVNVVDVTELEPEAPVLKKTAEKTALAGRYALDSYSDVQNAIDYFNENWTAMPPEHRREFCVKTAARADEFGIELSEIMDRYGSPGYAPDVEAHLANRRSVAPQYKEVWNALSEKRASLSPDTFVELLRKADESAGIDYDWGGAVADPYYATYGGRHDTEKLAWAWEDGQGEAVSEEQLRSIPAEQLSKSFTPDFVQAFSLNPTAIFDSMPAEHKTIIARMARV